MATPPQRLIFFNTSILTEYGSYDFMRITLDEAKAIIREFQDANKPILSAIGHESTAGVMSSLLGVPVAVNRETFRQDVGDQAIVFKLRQRPSEGAILNKEELERIGFDFGLLTRTR